jgi:hypothetical protein
VKHWARWALADRFIGRGLGVIAILAVYWLFFQLYALMMPVLR